MNCIRKRKAAALDDTPAKQPSTKAARLGKENRDESQPRASKCPDIGVIKRVEKCQPNVSTEVQSTAMNRKRKRVSDTSKESKGRPAGEETDMTHTTRNSVNESTLVTPQRKRFRDALPPSPAATPSKNAAQLFGRLNLRAASPSLNKKVKGYDTPPDTPESLRCQYDEPLPEELCDFLDLHAAFLTAVSSHCAHNGSSGRIDLGELLPVIKTIWNKRTVTLQDVQKVLCQAQEVGFAFDLEDFGRAGVCLVRTRNPEKAPKDSPICIDTLGLAARAEHATRESWNRTLYNESQPDTEPKQFIKDLPLAEISQSDSVKKTEPLFARGQQRLADLKSSQAAARRDPPASSGILTATDKNSTAVQNRGSSLLDRILAKQAYAASMPAGPTKQQLERTAALHRIEEVVRVLDLVSMGKSRVSISMQSAVQQLQQSLRNPISRSEAELCLEIIAVEIMPAFVSLVRSKTVTGVVVTRAGKLGFADLKSALANAGA